MNHGDKSSKIAQYEKTVDNLEIHEKLPIDKGHIIVILLLPLVFGIATYTIF